MKTPTFKNLLCRVWLAAAIAVGPSPAGAFSQPVTLRGLTAVAVGIGELPQELKDIGLKEKDLYDIVLKGLEKTAIKINPVKFPIADDPDLLLDVFGGELLEGVITYCIDLRLDQGVYLERDDQIRSDATTWSQKMIGVAGYGTQPTVIHNQVRQLVDRFVEEYLAENPSTP